MREKEYEAGWVGKGGRSGRRWRGRENIVKIYYMKNRIKKKEKKKPCFSSSLELKFIEPGMGVCGADHQCF